MSLGERPFPVKSCHFIIITKKDKYVLYRLLGHEILWRKYRLILMDSLIFQVEKWSMRKCPLDFLAKEMNGFLVKYKRIKLFLIFFVYDIKWWWEAMIGSCAIFTKKAFTMKCALFKITDVVKTCALHKISYESINVCLKKHTSFYNHLCWE